MGWKIPRGRYGVDALEPKEINRLQAAPESASDHIAGPARRARRWRVGGTSPPIRLGGHVDPWGPYAPLSSSALLAGPVLPPGERGLPGQGRPLRRA
jgi:hypothetical protein